MKLKLFKSQNSPRRGTIIVLSAVLLVVLLGFVALTVDVGFIQMTRTQLQSAADAGALAGATELSGSADAATVRTNVKNAVVATGLLHRNGDQNALTINPNTDITFGKIYYPPGSSTYSILWGDAQSPYSVVKVRAQRSAGSGGDNRLPLFIAPVIGNSKAEVWAEAIATFQPRDIMVVLDFSGSMNDDSCFGRIGTLGRTYIENNLQTMWTQLGSPIYGNLTFTPKYATLIGRTASGTIPHVQVTYKRTSVSVTSTLAMTQVRFEYSDGSTQNLAASGTSGSFSASSGKTISKCWVKAGTNASLSSGNYGEQFSFTSANIKTALGLNGAYPYPGGSWDDYISQVQSSSGQIKDAGYRDMYGYMTWINYLQYFQYGYDDTPDLWKTSEQPVGVLKDSVDVFVDYIKSVEANDKIGLSIYTHTNSAGAILEHALSTNLDQIKTTTRQRQAGHYKSGTNISAGMKTARLEMTANARPNAFKMMVLMTDGLPNEPGTDSQAAAAVITEANAAAAAKIKILTVCVGAGADTSLLTQVATITGGTSYVVPGGSSIDTVRTQLQDVFRQIAASRPLKLISGN